MSVALVIGLWVLGALIGIVAADRRGFSRAAGSLGGLLLGPFAVLLFLVSSTNRRCPSCVAWIPRAARTCSHCGHDVPPMLPMFPADVVEDDRAIVRRMAVQIVVGTVVITTVVLIGLNLLVR